MKNDDDPRKKRDGDKVLIKECLVLSVKGTDETTLYTIKFWPVLVLCFFGNLLVMVVVKKSWLIWSQLYRIADS